MATKGLIRNLPNAITLFRLVLVPLVVAMITAGWWRGAFICFLVAGISDGLDGWIARRFHMHTELGAHLDPLADKALLISIYVSLAAEGLLPVALVFLMCFRDIMIMSGIVVSWGLGKPIQIRPLPISKINTVAQILFAGLALAKPAFDWQFGVWWPILMGLVAILTLASAVAYLSQWLRHMGEAPHP